MKREKGWHARQRRLFLEATKRVNEKFGKKPKNIEGLRRGQEDGIAMGEW